MEKQPLWEKLVMGAMAQQLGELTALAEVLGLVAGGC